MTDARTTAAAVKDSIGRFGGAFMISRELAAFGAERELPGLSAYFRGRCGVLGEVDADVVTAVAGFFTAETVRTAWEAGRELPAAEAAAGMAEVCHGFALRKLAGFSSADAARAAELLGRIVERADPMAVPLFAGWRAMPLPDDPICRFAQLAHVLREYRGGLHVAAVRASGLSPLEAVLSNDAGLLPPGAANAEIYGWAPPYPEVDERMRERRAAAEDLTRQMVEPAFAVLTGAESDELVKVLDAACAMVFRPR